MAQFSMEIMRLTGSVPCGNQQPSWDSFRAMCEKAIAKYNARPHDGLPRFRDEVTGVYRHYSPDEFWALHVADGFEPVPVEAEEMDDLFRPYDERKARRGLVEWNTNKYYHPALEAYHDQWVAVGYDFAEARFVWVRELDREHGQPGRLICVADFTENKVDYVPKTYQRAAEEKRHQGRVNRNDSKRRDIDAEINAPFLLDLPAFEPMPVIDLAPLVAPAGPVLVVNNDSAEPLAQAARPIIISKQDLARHALANPADLTSNQVRVLRDCLQRQTEIELLRLEGIDVDALYDVVRSVA